MTISRARLSGSGSIDVRTTRCAGANEISGDALSESFSPAPTDNPDIVSRNPQRMARTFIGVPPLVSFIPLLFTVVQVMDQLSGPLCLMKTIGKQVSNTGER